MKLMYKLLLLVAELAVSCRGMEWDSVEDLDFWEKWKGVENQYFRERIPQSTSPSPHHPYVASHTSATNEPTSGPSTLGVSHHFMMEDHAMSQPPTSHSIYSSPIEPNFPWPIHSHSNTPFNYFEHTPASLDSEGTFFEGLPTDTFPKRPMMNEYAASEGLKIADQFPEQVTSSQDAISHIDHSDVPLSKRIGMKEEEVKLHQLVFDMNAFKFLESKDEKLASKEKMIINTINNHPAEPGLVITKEEMDRFMQPFRSTHPKNENQTQVARVSHLASRALTEFLQFTGAWEAVYRTRLGINFIALRKWIADTFTPGSVRTTNFDIIAKMNQHFVAYIFFVDMIITILRVCPEEGEVNRIEVFRRAADCFERYTKQAIAENTFRPGGIARIDYLWSFVDYWLAQESFGF
ncbi:hypothetical protein PCASD_16949 [Puccinia coronata f. sp. avenae]|uniref:Uncharacterized protein n=1 Tax=Puccinia coronata f. sp. avenae TaxID=200324 RepID=A0A2N5SY86_9BASI|nr:hypothetical protein PCASD_16949 [Puccinia coronata f. sp. avenae]